MLLLPVKSITITLSDISLKLSVRYTKEVTLIGFMQKASITLLAQLVYILVEPF
jgi:hypothetical protein